MKKDPAILWYPDKWIGGTMLLMRPHKGAYMDILMAQWANGHLTEKEIKTLLGPQDEYMWEEVLRKKFSKDPEGKYFNQMLEDTMVKRRSYTESRINNLQKKQKDQEKTDSHMGSHMEPHMLNININANINKDIEEKSGVEEERAEIFKVFGKAYPGSKRSFATEYENFRKKHKDWKEVLPILSERLAYQVRAREKRKLAGGFVPEWKNLKTWINQRCWEEIISMEVPNNKAMLPKTYEEMLRMAEKDPEVFKRYKPVKREGERKSVYYPIEQL